MAFADICIQRDCPVEAFEFVEKQVKKSVGSVVYGLLYPEEASVTARAPHATIEDTFMEVNVKVDYEDLPNYGWHITESGLCVRDDHLAIAASSTFPDGVPLLSQEIMYRHHLQQGAILTGAIATNSELWTEEIGWDPRVAAENEWGKVGALVEPSLGAWHQTPVLPKLQ